MQQLCQLIRCEVCRNLGSKEGAAAIGALVLVAVMEHKRVAFNFRIYVMCAKDTRQAAAAMQEGPEGEQTPITS